MTASDEVAQLPGGQAVAALAAQVRGNPGAIRQIASGWAKAAGDCTVNTAAVRGAVSEVRRDWKGGSAEAFGALMERFCRAGHRTRQAMRAAARALEGAAGSLEEAQRSVEGICERLLAEVSQLRGTDPPLSRSRLDATISGLASEAASAVRPHVAAAQQALERAAGKLDAGLAELNGSFSALPKPGSQGFAGGWQTLSGWHPAGTPALASGPMPASSAPASTHGILSSLHGSTQAGRTAGSAPSGPGLPPAAGSAAPVSAQWGAAGGGSGDAGAGSGGSGGAGAGDGAGGTLGSGSLMPPGAGGPAPPAQVDGWIQQAIKILEAQGIPASRLSAQDIWIIIQHESGGNPDAINNWDANAAAGDPSRGLMQCVPLRTRILTRRGWRRHDEVRAGDETLGYDPASGRSEWTPVRKVVHYDDGVVWRIGNRSWRADVTPNHRWWSDTRDVRDGGRPPVCPECGYASSPRGVSVHRWRAHRVRRGPAVTYRGEYVRTDGLSPAHRLRLAAPAATHGIPGLALDDVRIIAWLQAAHRATEHGTAGDHAGTQPAGYDVTICPSAPRQVVRLRALLAGVDHTEHARRPGGGTVPACGFRLHRAYVTELLKRSRLIETGPEAFVLALSPDQRAAWLDSAADAGGCGQPPKNAGHGRFSGAPPAEATFHDAIRLAVYLEGYRPTPAGGGAGRGGRRPAGVAGMAAPHVAPSRFGRPRVLDRQPVWCVKTDLQTWTACQDGQIFLTGNTIGSTFDTYALPGHHDIFNPVDNIIAGVRYALARYGSLGNVPGVLAVHNGQPYVGY